MSVALVTGDGCELSAYHHSLVQAGTVAKDLVVFDLLDKFKATVVTNNKIRLSSGAGLLQGRLFVTDHGDSTDITIENGTQGRKRIDLIVARINTNQQTKLQSVEFAVVKGTPSTSPQAPEVGRGNLITGDDFDEVVLYTVNIDGLSISTVTQEFEVLTPNDETKKTIESLSARLMNQVELLAEKVPYMYLSDYLLVDTYTVKTGTIAANSLGSVVETNITKDGYAPLAVAGVRNTGNMSSWLVAVENYISGNKHYLRARNTHSGTSTSSDTSVAITILYVKTEV